MNVIKRSIAFRIRWIRFPRTTGHHPVFLYRLFPEICRIKENPQAYIFWPFFITLVHIRLNMLFKESEFKGQYKLHHMAIWYGPYGSYDMGFIIAYMKSVIWNVKFSLFLDNRQLHIKPHAVSSFNQIPFTSYGRMKG